MTYLSSQIIVDFVNTQKVHFSTCTTQILDPKLSEDNTVYILTYFFFNRCTMHFFLGGGEAMANYLQELAQDAVCQSHTGHMTGLWFLPTRPLKAEY